MTAMAFKRSCARGHIYPVTEPRCPVCEERQASIDIDHIGDNADSEPEE